MNPIKLLVIILSLFTGSAVYGLTAGFTATPTTGCAPLLVSFHNTTSPSTGTTYVWSFGSSSSSILTDPSTSFTTPGTHIVTLTATNGSAVSTYTLAVTVHPPPIVSFTATDTTVCPGTPITFASTSTGGVPGPMTYSWNWGDGSPTSPGGTTTHIYTLPGSYTVTLFVTNATGCVASLVKSAHITVYNPPIANFTWAPFSICNPPGTVTFSSSSSGTPPLSTAWFFGDGGIGSGSTPAHPYTTVGVYSPTLVVTDANGCVDSVSLGPVVVDTIRAAFICPIIACRYATVIFPNTSSTHLTRIWNYGDGSPTETLVTGAHVYNSVGTYTVTLTINNPPCTQTVTHVITIVDGPAATFTIAPIDPCPAPATITYTAAGPPGTIYNWVFEPGTGTGSPVTHTYPTNGIKTVRMITVDPITGCRDTFQQTHTIYNLFFEANAAPLSGCKPLPVTFSGSATTTIPGPGTTPYPYPLISYTWNFDDGSPLGSGPTPTHTFTEVGTYDVTVNAMTANGCPVTDVIRILVGKPPQVSFTAAPLHVCYGEHIPVVFTPSVVVGPVDTWVWNYGDDGETISDTASLPALVYHTYTLPGLFTVSVTPYYNGCPGVPFIRTDYVLIDSPKSIIEFNLICNPRTRVQFTNGSLGDDTHLWIFGDGFTSTDDDPLHDYPAIAVYTVTLTTYNTRSGCRDTATSIVDLRPPVFTFTADDTTVCQYDSVTFTAVVSVGSAIEYRWQVTNPALVGGDITPGPVFGIRFYATTGEHHVRLIIVDGFGCLDTLMRPNYVTVGKPVPDFTAFPLSGCVPLTVIFTDGSTAAGGTSLVSYEWTFGDGATSTVTTPITAHTYTAAGIYNVTEIVIDDIGCRDTIIRPSYITAYKPVAAFTASNTHPCINGAVNFTNTSSGGVVTSDWEFGDGGTSTLTSPSHVYTLTGSYTVKLTVTDAHGCTDIRIVPGLINVADPVAGFTMSDSVSVCPPLFVNFTNTSTGASVFAWDFGDATGSTVVSPSNMYIASGLFNVRLIATSIYGCKDTVIHPVNIFGYAGAFDYDPIQGCVPLTVNFSATLSNVPFITWDFSDGVTSSMSYTNTTTHIYTTPGAYVPKLILSDNTGCQTSSTGIDTIKVDEIYPKMTTDPSPVCISAEFSFIDSSTSFWSPVTIWEWTYDGNTSILQSPTHTINVPGTYPVTLKVENGWGCKATITKNIVILPPPDVTASPDTVVCVSDPATLRGYGAVTYTWAAPATLSCTACNPTYATPLEVTTYTVTGADANGCKDSATVTVGLRTHTIAKAWGDTAVCQGVPVQVFDTGGHTYLWLPPTGLSNNTIFNPIATPPYTTIYTVIARLGSCIPDTNQVTVFIYPLPTVDAGPDQRLLAGSTAQLNAKGTDIATLEWSPASTLSCTDCYNPVASMSVMTTYNIDVVSDRGCKASDSVRILLYCDNSMVFVPNAFTPNGDGQNDVFYPRGMGIKEIKTFRVYNRWGQMLFERQGITLNDAGNAWDGTYKGDIPKPDVYVYIIEAVCFTGEDVHIKGDVSILK